MVPSNSGRTTRWCAFHDRKYPRLGGVVGMIFSLLLSSGVAAQTPDSGWQFIVSPYLWGAGLSGTAGTLPGVPPADIDLSFKDILSDLDAAGMIVGNARNGRFGITADIQYVRTTSDGQTPGPLYGATRLKSTTTAISLSGEYLLSESQTSQIWATAGLRYWDVKTEFNLGAGTLPARTALGRSKWWDPVIGLRGRADIGRRSFVTGWAYVGGFGLGSEFMSDVFGGVGYQFSDLTSGVVGWRYSTVDRRDGSFVYDVRQSGPILGLTFNF
jgi:hypothetical protein